jgi:hypothetical protein
MKFIHIYLAARYKKEWVQFVEWLRQHYQSCLFHLEPTYIFLVNLGHWLLSDQLGLPEATIKEKLRKTERAEKAADSLLGEIPDSQPKNNHCIRASLLYLIKAGVCTNCELAQVTGQPPAVVDEILITLAQGGWLKLNANTSTTDSTIISVAEIDQHLLADLH